MWKTTGPEETRQLLETLKTPAEEIEDKIMFRKITLTVVPAAILALMVCAVDSSASSAFAKGGPAGKFGKGLHNNMHNHRDFHNRYFGRYYGWGYASYGCEYPVCAPVCQPTVPVVAEAPPRSARPVHRLALRPIRSTTTVGVTVAITTGSTANSATKAEAAGEDASKQVKQ